MAWRSLTDKQWDLIKEHLPKRPLNKKGGRPPVEFPRFRMNDDREVTCYWLLARHEAGEDVRDAALAAWMAQRDGDERPNCPVCGKRMVRRVAKRGASAGAAFWGCVDYPGCKGTRGMG